MRDLQDSAWVMLLYAMRGWPAPININLWPYATRAASDTHNSLPLEIFSGVNVRPSVRHHHFGCPVYVLDGDL